MKKGRKSFISPFAVVSVIIFLSVMLMLLISELSEEAADYLNSTVCHRFRMLTASFGDLFPFSLSEILIFLLPLWLFIIIRLAYKRFKEGRGISFALNLFAVILLIFPGHTLALGIAYNTTPIDEKMALPEYTVTEEDLASAMIRLRDEVNYLSGEVIRDEGGVFTLEYGFSELSEEICHAFDLFNEKYYVINNFDGQAKGVAHGNLMSYLKITGIYTFPTGEANVNTAYPSYDNVYTAAHEMSHARGILRENEANFIAYAALSRSPYVHLRYSAALSMYEYVCSALYKTNKEKYREIAAELSPLAIADMQASRAVTEKYGNTVIARISERVNDIFLKSNGTDGVISYSKSVELTLAYFAAGN